MARLRIALRSRTRFAACHAARGLGTAMLYAYHFHSDGSDTAPGSTTLGVSTAVLRALTRTGA